ncbi:hypothetical protein T492DRAFT_942531 [Pavlovales sp. CCMP2436]|nr:hypothetical protein T492DRAFT_942531 [Pavlovales sp. CCMP2436]
MHTLHARALQRSPHMPSTRPAGRRAVAVMLDAESLRQLGPAAFSAAVFVADMVPGVPTQPIAIASGAVFGFQEGLAAVCIGQALAAAGALALARSPAAKAVRDKAEEMLGEGAAKRSLDAIAKTVDSQSALGVFGSIVGVRQSPVIPFSIGNYYLGLFTRAPIASVVAGTVVGCLPLNALWVYVGATTGDALTAILSGEKVDVSLVLQSPAGTALEVLGSLATAALAVVAFKALRGAQELEPETFRGDD